MNKWVVRYIAVFVINVFGMVLTAVTLWILISKNDPILAAVPFLVLLPIALLQPWFALFLIASALVGPKVLTIPVGLLLTTGTTIWLWACLDRAGKLERVKLIMARLKNRATFLMIGLAAFWLCVIGVARYVDFPPLHRGTPPNYVLPINDLKIDMGNPRYYCVRDFFDSEWLLRAKISERELQAMADKLQMHAIPSEALTKTFWKKCPYWWRPVRSESVKCLSMKNPELGLPTVYWATWNPQDGLLHMWIINRFD